MTSIRNVLLFYFLLHSSFLLAQNYNFQSLHVIKQTTTWIEVDKMQHLYTISEEHQLNKYDSKGNLLYQYNENSLGRISAVDVSNPFTILVYFDDYATIVLLDRTLSEIRRQDLSDLNIAQIQAIGIASDNNIWLFDNNTYTLKKIDAQNQVLQESPDLSMLITEAVAPTRLVEHNNRVYLNAPDAGVLVFDIFGNYAKSIDIFGIDYFQLFKGQLFFTENEKFKSYHLQSFEIHEIKLPTDSKNLLQVCIAQERLYIRYKDRVEILRIQKK